VDPSAAAALPDAAAANVSVQQAIDDSLAKAGFVRLPDGTVTTKDSIGIAKPSAVAGSRPRRRRPRP